MDEQLDSSGSGKTNLEKSEKKKKRKEEIKRLQRKLDKFEGRPSRGIETWFRLTSKNLYTRLRIVDTKSNILITANAIIISVVLGSLYPRLQEDGHYIFAVAGLVITNVISITFAILATIPRYIGRREDFEDDEIDIMSFDDFHQMSYEEYKEEVLEVMEDGDKLYPSMITDIHSLGLTLARKYNLIRKAYLVFLGGIILSVILFSVGHYLLHAITDHH